MTTITREMEKQIKAMRGSILGINLNSNMIESLKKNENITSCNLLENDGIGLFKGRNRKSKKGKSERVTLKRLIKRFGNKSHNFLIADLKTINSYKKLFMKDSINLTTTKVYLYIEEDFDESHLVAMYKRYTDVEIIECKDGKILKIETENIKTNYILDKVYFVVDIVWDLFDLISDVLVK